MFAKESDVFAKDIRKLLISDTIPKEIGEILIAKGAYVNAKGIIYLNIKI